MKTKVTLFKLTKYDLAIEYLDHLGIVVFIDGDIFFNSLSRLHDHTQTHYTR